MTKTSFLLVAVIFWMTGLFGVAGEVPEKGARAQIASSIAQRWVDAFATEGFSQQNLEAHLGHSLDRWTAADTHELQLLLKHVRHSRRGTNIRLVADERLVESETTPSDGLPVSPGRAKKLAEDVDATEADLHKILEELNETVDKLPNHFPPDLKQEAIVVEKYLELVRTLRKMALDFDHRSPAILEVASRHRKTLRHAIDALRDGAETDRANRDPGFEDLAAAEEVVGQAYGQRLDWADQMYGDLRALVTQIKGTLKLFDRWESVLVLMQPVVKEGAITQAERDKLLKYFSAIDDAMKSFRAFAEKARGATESGSSSPRETQPSGPSA